MESDRVLVLDAGKVRFQFVKHGSSTDVMP
jgi:hypothetical protein